MSGLRILGGEARGRILKTLKEDDLSVRPLLGRIKKSLFDILQFKIQNTKFLDLYAGTGAVGIEALSRGCSFVDFVEASNKSIELIEQNLKMLGWGSRGKIYKADITGGLGFLRQQYNIIFMGPPYKDEKKKMLALTTATLNAVCNANLLLPDGIIISQHHIKEQVAIPPEIEKYRQEKYGDTIINFYKKNNV